MGKIMQKISVRKDGSKRIQTIYKDAHKTDQQFKKDCDANHIIDKMKRTGTVTHLARCQGSYADVSEVTDLHDSLIKVEKARAAFMNLPGKIRQKFNNSMEDYVSFLQDPRNNEEAIALGLKVSAEKTDKSSKEPGAPKKQDVKKEKSNDPKNSKVDSNSN